MDIMLKWLYNRDLKSLFALIEELDEIMNGGEDGQEQEAIQD